jgi:hypothetical protein
MVESSAAICSTSWCVVPTVSTHKAEVSAPMCVSLGRTRAAGGASRADTWPTTQKPDDRRYHLCCCIFYSPTTASGKWPPKTPPPTCHVLRFWPAPRPWRRHVLRRFSRFTVDGLRRGRRQQHSDVVVVGLYICHSSPVLSILPEDSGTRSGPLSSPITATVCRQWTSRILPLLLCLFKGFEIDRKLEGNLGNVLPWARLVYIFFSSHQNCCCCNTTLITHIWVAFLHARCINHARTIFVRILWFRV